MKLIYSTLELELLLMWGFLSPKKDLQLKILTSKNFSADVKSTIHSLSRLSSIRHSFPFGQILELINLFISKYMSMPSMLYAVS